MSKFLAIVLALLSFLWTVIGALVMWAGQVTPEQAVANWQTWLNTPLPAWIYSDEARHGAIAIGLCIVVSGLLGLVGIWRRWLLSRQGPGIYVQPEPFISFQEAATRTYEEFQKKKSIMREAADTLSDNCAIGWCASYLLQKNIAVYGTRPPSRIRELIPHDELRHLHVENNVTELHEVMSSRNPIWTNLEVRLDDLAPILERVDEYPQYRQ